MRLQSLLLAAFLARCGAFFSTFGQVRSFNAPSKCLQHKLKTVCMLGEQNGESGNDLPRIESFKQLQAELKRVNEEYKKLIDKNNKLNEEYIELKGKLEVNPYVLMTSPVPVFLDNTKTKSSTSSSTSNSVSRLLVERVSYFRDFKERQKSFTLSIKQELEQRANIAVYPFSSSIDGRVSSSETDIYKILDSTSFFALNRLQEEVETGSAERAGVSVRADFVSFVKKSLTPLVVFEVKRRNLVTYGTDLVRDFWSNTKNPDKRDNSGDSIDAIQKLVGYLMLAKIQYGILTTGLYYWVVKVLEDGNVLVSEPYSCLDAGPNSVLSMLYYIIHLALEDFKNGKKFKPPLFKRVADPLLKQKSAARGKRSGSQSGMDSTGTSDVQDGTGWGSVSGTPPTSATLHDAAIESFAIPFDGFRCLRFLEEHPDRVTFQAQIGGDGAEHCLVAVKAFDTPEARNAEVRLLCLLKPLQVAGAIPTLLDGQLELEWTDPEQRRVHALMISWVGPPDAGGRVSCRSPPIEFLRKARETLEMMHALGVAHGDVRLPNLSYDPGAGRVFVLDLSHGVARSEANFEVQCAVDLREMDQLISAAEVQDAVR